MTQLPDPDTAARNRFLALTAVRFSGAALAAFGLAILADKLPFALPHVAGYAFLAFGLLDALVVPMILVRSWKTPPQ